MAWLTALTGLLTGCAAPPAPPPVVEWAPAARLGHGSPRLALAMPDQQVAVATTLGVGVWRLDGGPPVWFAETATEPLGLSATPDGQLVGAALAGGWVRVWREGALVLETESEGAGVALAPDGHTVAFGRGGEVRVLGLEGDSTDRALGRAGARLAALTFDATGTQLGAVDRSGLAVVWSAVGAEIGRTQGRSPVYHGLAWSPDGRLALAGEPSALWTPGGEILNLEGPIGPASAVAFSPDGQTVAVAGIRGGLVWSDARSGARLGGETQGAAPVRSVAGTADGWLLVGATVARVTGPGAAPVGLLPMVDAVSLVAARDDGLVAALSTGALVIWGEGGGAVSLGVTHGPLRLAFLPDGRALAITARELLLVEARDGGTVFRREFTQILAADLSPDRGTVALVAREAGATRLLFLSATTGEPVPGPELKVSAPSDLRWSPDGASLAVLDGREARVFKLATGAEEGRIIDASGRAGTIAWSSAGALAVGLSDGGVSVWRGGEIERWKGTAAGDALVMLAWRPDGGALAALGQDTGGSAHLSLFDASTGRYLLELPGAGDVGHGITFTPDGGLLFGLFGSNPAADGQKPGLVVAWDGAGAVHARWDALSAGDWWSVASGAGGLVMGSGTGFAQRFVPTP